MTGFVLPPLLQAERAGRELARRAKAGTGIVAGPGLPCAAAWAATRQAANLGRQVEVIFSARDETNSANTASNQPFAAAGLERRGTGSQPEPGGADDTKTAADLAAQTMADTARRLGLASARQVSAGLAILPERGALSADEFLRFTHAWRPEEGADNPYLWPARIEDAQPAAAIRELDRRAIEDYGLPGLCLMENAGLGATAVAREMLALVARTGGPVALLVGAGNNGGDALVVARELLTRGVNAKVILLSEPAKLRGDAAANWEIYTAGGGPAEPAPDTDTAWDALLAEAVLIVDGLFGTGLARPLEGRAAQAVAAVNRARERGVKVLALDLPSGLDADTGEIRGAAIRADRTVTFAAPKLGFWKASGPELAGQIVVADIGFRLPKTNAVI